MRRAGRLATMQDEALAVLCAYGIPVVPSRAVASADDAAAAASLLGYPAVVKLRQSVRPDARASGGLALDLHDATEVTAAAERIAARGLSLLVQRQAVRWRQLRIRVDDDATFGPIISFGQGGTTADIAGDASADLPPLNLALAHGLIGRTRAASTLARVPRQSAGERARCRRGIGAGQPADRRFPGDRRTGPESADRRHGDGVKSRRMPGSRCARRVTMAAGSRSLRIRSSWWSTGSRRMASD